MLETMMMSKTGLDPQNNRNKCKLIWDSSSTSRTRARSQGPAPTTIAMAKPPPKPQVIPYCQRPQAIKAKSTQNGHVGQCNPAVVQSCNVGVVSMNLDPSQTRRRSISNIIADKMSMFEESKCERGNIKKKKKSVHLKVKISFDDHATTTFEYEGEESALQNYLIDHPEEKDEALKQEEERNGMESSTDEILNDSPRSPTEDISTMKSNTLIGVNTGSLTSYKSKMQTQDFQFGMSRNEEPEVTYTPDPEEETAPVDLLPADDTELDAFSAEVDKSDMLF